MSALHRGGEGQIAYSQKIPTFACHVQDMHKK